MYAKRLEIQYRDINEALTTIEVWQDDYEGASVQRDGQGDPLTIAWGDNAGDELPCIYASTATVRFYQDEEGEFSDLFDSNKFKNRLQISKDGAEIWRGYVRGETWEEERLADGIAVAVEFTATDMLTALKDVKLLNPAGWIAEYQTIDDVVTYILKDVTGLDLPVLHAINWEADKGQHYLDSLVNVKYLEGKSCYDILDSLLFGCRIFQRESLWNIIAYSVLESDEIVVTIPASLVDDFRALDYRAGDFRSRIPGTDTQYRYLLKADYWFEKRLNLELLRGYRSIIINEDQGLIENLVVNGDFENGLTDWTQTGLVPNGFAVKKRENKEITHYAYLPGRSALYDMHLSQTSYYYMNSLEQLRIAFKYGLIGIDESALAQMYVRIKMTGSSSDRYLTYAVGGDDGLYLTWTSTPTNLRLGARAENGVIIHDDISCNTDYQDYTKKIRNFDLLTDDIELAGELEVRLFVPVTVGTDVIASIFTAVQVQVFDETGDVYENDNVVDVPINTAHFEDYEKDLMIVDGAEINNLRNVYAGALLMSNYGHAVGWRIIGGSTYYPLNEHRALVIKALTSQTRSNYHATVADARADMRIIISDTEAEPTTKRLLENGVTYNDRYNQLEGQFTEIKV